MGCTSAKAAAGDSEVVSRGLEGALEVELQWGFDSSREWDGWGTSLCWWATALGQQEHLADVFFTLNEAKVLCHTLPGLGLNIVRYCVGGSSSSATCFGQRQNTGHQAPRYKQTEGFWVSPSWAPAMDDPKGPCWDWSRDANQVNMLKLAKDRGVEYLEAFSNSPMWWMLKNHSPFGGVLQQNNLKDDHFGNFAKYLAITLQHFKAERGIEFTSLSPFNEPTMVLNFCPYPQTQERTPFNADLQAWVLGLLHTELNARGLEGVALSASDETSAKDAVSTWEAFDKARIPMAAHMSGVWGARDLVKKLNVHGYKDPTDDELRKVQGLTHMCLSRPALWMSEYGDADRSGATLAKEIFRHLRNMKPTGWCLWQVIDPEWGLMHANLGGDQPVDCVHNKYWVYAHFTRPHSQRHAYHGLLA